MFTNAQTVVIDNKEVQSIVASNGGVLYEKPVNNSLILSSNKNSVSSNETVTLSATLTLNGSLASNETVVFTTSNDVILSQTTLTDTIERFSCSNFYLDASALHYDDYGGTLVYNAFFLDGIPSSQYIEISNPNTFVVYDSNKGINDTYNFIGLLHFKNGILSFTDNNNVVQSIDISDWDYTYHYGGGGGIILYACELTATTDSNGVASVTYTGSGKGDLNIKAVCSNVESEITIIEDCLFFDESSQSNLQNYSWLTTSNTFSYDSTDESYLLVSMNNTWRRLQLDNIIVPSHVKVEMDCKIKISSGSGENYDSYFAIAVFDSSNNYGVAGYFIHSREYFDGKIGTIGEISSTDSRPSNQTNQINYNYTSDNWYHVELIINGTSATVNFYDGDTLVGTSSKTITGFANNNNKLIFPHYINTNKWSKQTDAYFKNIKIKPLY